MAEIVNPSPESPVELVTVDRPEAGETLTVHTVTGQRIVLAFDPDDARFGVAGDDFILTFEDGAGIVFEGLVTAAQGTNAPTIQIAGIDVGAGALIEQVLALSGQVQVEPIETAAGEEGEGVEAAGGGGSRYDDSFGDLISGLIEQGVIGETELNFGLIAGENIELPVDTGSLSQGSASSGGGSDSSATSSSIPSTDDDPAPNAPPVSDGGGDVVASYTFGVDPINIITNEATGNLEIPDELILYLANPDPDNGEVLRVTGPSNGDGDNAFIWEVDNQGDPVDSEPLSPNTWANHVTDNVKFHIGNGNPYYEGSLTYEVADGLGGTGVGEIGVENFTTENVRGYWTLDGTDNAEGTIEVLLGQDGRNNIFGGGGDDIIHGGHDSSGDILRGGSGDDVIFGGSGNDDLQGDAGDDTFIMLAGFSRDDVDGGAGDTDTITLDGLLTQDDLDNLSSWLTLDSGYSITGIVDGVISLSADASGTIDLGGGNVIDFLNIEQIDYANAA